jgi:hypothetical protein
MYQKYKYNIMIMVYPVFFLVATCGVGGKRIVDILLLLEYYYIAMVLTLLPSVLTPSARQEWITNAFAVIRGCWYDDAVN